MDFQCDQLGYLITQGSKHTLYRGKDCMKRFFSPLREQKYN